MLYFGMSYQFDMMSDNLVAYKGTKFTEYEDIEQEVEEDKSNFSVLWDKVLGAVPHIASYTGGLLTGFANSFLPIDFFDYSEQSDTFRAGLRAGDILGAAVGMALIDAGSGGMVVGTTVVCTGVGAPVGVAIDAGSAAAMGLGGLMMFNSARNATKPDRYKGSSSSGSGGGGKKPPKKERKISQEEYDDLRKDTPTDEIREKINRNHDKTVVNKDEVLGGKEFKGALEADHIVSMDKISRMDGFDKLSREQRLKVLNNEENFVGLSKSANTSKGTKSFEEWTHYKAKSKNEIEVNPDFRKKMMLKESEMEIKLQKQIKEINKLNK